MKKTDAQSPPTCSGCPQNHSLEPKTIEYNRERVKEELKNSRLRHTKRVKSVLP
jgi:hypothetical protein